jgi:hypothetical protein
MHRDDISIKTPCHLDWSKMTPADGGRFCGDCKKVVRDLSGMSEPEARALIRSARTGELCVRYVYDAQGRIFFAGMQSGLVPAAMLSRAKRAARAALAVAAPLTLAACDAAEHAIPGSSGTVMGAMEWSEPPDAGDGGDDEDGGDAGAKDGGRSDAAARDGGDAAPQRSDAGPDGHTPI